MVRARPQESRWHYRLSNFFLKDIRCAPMNESKRHRRQTVNCARSKKVMARLDLAWGDIVPIARHA